jgi:hypothetical protein
MKSLYNRTQKITRIPLIILAILGIHMNTNGMALIDKLKSIYKEWAETKATAALEDAIRHKRHGAAEAALKKGANPNGRSHLLYSPYDDVRPKGEPFIELAVGKEDEPMVKLLLAYKATPNCDTDGFDSPLMRSTRWTKNTSIFKILLAHNADIKYKTKIPSFNIVSALVDIETSRLSSADCLSSILLIMEKPECDDSDIACAYNYIDTSPITFAGEKGLQAKKLLDDARIKNYSQRITQLIAKILEINPPDKAQIIFTPLARIIAEYYCIATRPLAITLTKP